MHYKDGLLHLGDKIYEIPPLYEPEIEFAMMEEGLSITDIDRDISDDAYTLVRDMYEELALGVEPIIITHVPSGAEVTRGICQCGYGDQIDKHIEVISECECGILGKHNHCHNCGSLTEVSQFGTMYI